MKPLLLFKNSTLPPRFLVFHLGEAHWRHSRDMQAFRLLLGVPSRSPIALLQQAQNARSRSSPAPGYTLVLRLLDRLIDEITSHLTRRPILGSNRLH